MTTAIAAERWISQAEARRQLSVGKTGLAKLIGDGRIRVRRLPGVRDLVSWADVERLANQALTEG